MSKKVAVVLSGCGVYDGTEAYEGVLTLLYLSQRGAEVQCFAPSVDFEPVDHLSGESMAGQSRNALTEAGRLVRGQVKPLSEADPNAFDALIVPGGFGAAKNLCNYARVGSELEVNPEFLTFAQQMHKQSKPIGLICIAPVMSSHICGQGASCTIGNDEAVAGDLAKMGAEHVQCPVDDIHVDETHKLVTTPAYMLAQTIAEAASGIEKLVDKVISL